MTQTPTVIGPILEAPVTNEIQELLRDAGGVIPKTGDVVDGQVIGLGRNEVIIDIAGQFTGVVRGPEIVDESGMIGSLKVGDTVPATVIAIDNEQGIFELSFRAAGHHRAWSQTHELMRSHTAIPVRVTEANRGGLMVRLGNLPGFLPVSQLAPEHYPRVEGGDKGKILERLKSFIGSDIQVRVIDVQEKEGKLIVSERANREEEEAARLANYHIGDAVKGKISGVVDFGAFVEFGDGLEGLIHISELSWQRVTNPRDVVTVGQEIEVKIIGIDRNRISLSLKALTTDPWIEAAKRYEVGQEVQGKITRINPFGLFIELDSQISGLAHISELELAPGQKLEEYAKAGDTMHFFIISLEPAQHRLGLSKKKKATTEEAKPVSEPAT